MASAQSPVEEMLEDPLAYAQETHRLSMELQNYIFPPWRWPRWYRQRRIIEERLARLRALADYIDSAERRPES